MNHQSERVSNPAAPDRPADGRSPLVRSPRTLGNLSVETEQSHKTGVASSALSLHSGSVGNVSNHIKYSTNTAGHVIRASDTFKEPRNRLSLSGKFQSFIELIVGTTSESTNLEVKIEAAERELEIYNQWIQKRGAMEKSSDPEKQEVVRLKKELNDLRQQVSQREERRKSAARDIFDTFSSLGSESVQLLETEQTSVSSQINQLQDENKSLRQALEQVSNVAGEQAARLSAIEDKISRDLSSIQAQKAAQGGATETRLQKVESQVSHMETLVRDVEARKAPLECKNQVDTLTDRIERLESQTSANSNALRDEQPRHDALQSQLNSLVGRLGVYESLAKDIRNEQGLSKLRDSIHEVDAKYNDLEMRVNEKLKSSMSDIVEQIRSTELAQLSSSTERLQKELQSLNHELLAPTRGVRPAVERLEERLASVEKHWGETSEALRDLRNNAIQSSSASPKGTETRLAAMESILQQQGTTITELTQSNSKLTSDVDQRFKSVQDSVQLLQATASELRDDSLETQQRTSTRDDPSIMQLQLHGAQTAWEVDEGRQSTPNGVPRSSEGQEVKQKLSTLENYILSHEQRLNTFTLEPFLRSIIHQMRVMYPYPDHISRSIESFRVSNQQRDSQLAEIQARLIRAETDMKKKPNSAELLPAMLPHLNQIKQEADSLKAAIGELQSRVKEPTQTVWERLIADNAELTKRLEKFQDQDAFKATHPAKVTASSHAEEDDGDMSDKAMKMLEDFMGDTHTRFESVDDKFSDEMRMRDQLREDVVTVMDSTKSEYDEELNNIRADVSRLRIESVDSARKVKEVENGLVKVYKDLQKEVVTLKLGSEKNKVTRMRSSFSPVTGNESSSSHASMRPGERLKADFGQSMLRKSKKRRRGDSGGISESDEQAAEGSRKR